MATQQEMTAMFETFIASEDRAVANGTQGDWYCMNWYRLKDHLRKAPALLPEDRLERFYLHLLRLRILPNKAELGNAYAVLERAYRMQIQYMPPGVPFGAASMLHRFDGLLLFGFDYRAALAVNDGVDDYLRYRDVFNQFNKYSHVPGMLSKGARFAPYADDEKIVGRICDVLTGLQFIQDDYYQPDKPSDPGHYSYVQLPFWAAIFTLLLSRFEPARTTLEAFRAAGHLPLRDQHVELFERFEQASAAFRPGIRA